MLRVDGHCNAPNPAPFAEREGHRGFSKSFPLKKVLSKD